MPQSMRTADVLRSHGEAVDSGDVERIVADYAPRAVLITPEGCVRGHAALRAYWERFLRDWSERFTRFEMIRQEVEGEAAYILWKCPPEVPLATDTFVIRDGKIVVQTFAAMVTAPG